MQHVENDSHIYANDPWVHTGHPTDPLHRRFKGVVAANNIEFDVPFMQEVASNLYVGGCTNGLVLPPFICHVVSLYTAERYKLEHELGTQLFVNMRDALDQSTKLVDSLAHWVNECREDGPVLVHCFPDDTAVGGHMPTSIEHTTNVIGIDGLTHQVTHHHLDPYDGPLIVIKTTGALDVRVTPEHPIAVVRPYYFPKGFKAKPGMASLANVTTVADHYARQPVWLPASSIRPGDYVVSPRPIFNDPPQPMQWAERAYHCNSFKVGELQPDSDTAWMLGLYAADGGTMGENSISFTLSPRDDVDRLVKVWANIGLVPRVIEYTNYRRVVVNSRMVTASFREWFRKSDGKRLPAFAFDHGFPIADLVAGYTDGDGYTEKDGTITCHTISKTLVEQIRMAVLSLGLSPTVSEVRRHSGYPNAKPAWKIQWRKVATQHHTTWWKGRYLMPVTGVESEHYIGNVHNITVKDVETYTVNGLLVHNCQAGLNRSPLVVARALYHSEFDDSVDHVGADILSYLRTLRSPAVLCNKTFEAEVLSWLI